MEEGVGLGGARTSTYPSLCTVLCITYNPPPPLVVVVVLMHTKRHLPPVATLRDCDGGFSSGRSDGDFNVTHPSSSPLLLLSMARSSVLCGLHCSAILVESEWVGVAGGNTNTNLKVKGVVELGCYI